MPRPAPGGMRLPRIDELPENIARLMVARALAEAYRDALDEPIPERLAAILRRIENGEDSHRHKAT